VHVLLNIRQKGGCCVLTERTHIDALGLPVGSEQGWRHVHFEHLQLATTRVRGALQDLQVPFANLMLCAQKWTSACQFTPARAVVCNISASILHIIDSML
jgi:hypothetical protein